MIEHRNGDPIDVLLVEDNPGDVRLTQEAFKEGRLNNTLHVVTTGDAALDFLYQRGEHASAPRPEIVLLDLNLPTVDGMEVLEEIKHDPDLKPIPVVILTSSEAEETSSRVTNSTRTRTSRSPPAQVNSFPWSIRSKSSGLRW